VADVWCGGSGSGSGGVFDFGQALFDVCQCLLLAFAEAFEFLGYALLNLEFEGLCAGGVGL